MDAEITRRIEELRKELHELYKQDNKDAVKIDRVALKIRKLREGVDDD